MFTASENPADGAFFGLLFPLFQQKGTEHRGGGQGDEQRDQDGDGKGDGEFTEQATDDAAHQQDWDEDGNQGKADGHDCKADFLGTFHGGINGLHAILDIAHDVLKDNNRIVHHKAGGDGHRHQ